jgi:hypothetical protein
MAGHGSPPPEDRAHHPGRQVGLSESDRAIQQQLLAEKAARRAAGGGGWYDREKIQHDYEMGRMHDYDDYDDYDD